MEFFFLKKETELKLRQISVDSGTSRVGGFFYWITSFFVYAAQHRIALDAQLVKCNQQIIEKHNQHSNSTRTKEQQFLFFAQCARSLSFFVLFFFIYYIYFMVNYSVGKRLKHHSLLVHAACSYGFTQDKFMFCVCACVWVSVRINVIYLYR